MLALNTQLIDPLGARGATTLTNDHTPKDKNSQGTPLGSVQKMNQVTGALLILREEKKMGVGVKGSSGVYLTAKDPP